MSRIENVARNSIGQAASTLLSTLLGFVGRVLFMRILGEEYLGVSGLFTSVIGVLSFADLGLASAFTFCFYKPISRKDTAHIQALLTAFKKVIFVIASFITAAGLAVMPFLRILVKGADNIDDAHLYIYYLITLASTVISYWLMYKTCYVTARQEAYRLMPFTMVGNLVTVLLQIAALLFTRNYTVWALAAVVVSVGQRVVMDVYIRRRYPETKSGATMPLPEEDKKSIIANVKGIFMHKVGDICVNQTDNIIVSAYVSVIATGLLSNYVLIKTTVMSFVITIQSALMASMGDIMASENEDVQLNVFFTYLMLNYCMVGFSVCAMGVLSTPFITLLFGAGKTVDALTVFLICISFYITFQAGTVNVLSTAGGKFMLGAYAAIVEGISNLIFSVVAVKLMGLPGVFLGTVLSQIINYIIRPFPIFRGMYGIKPYKYFRFTVALFGAAMVPYGVLLWLQKLIFAAGVTWGRFVAMAALTVLIFAASVWAFWHKNHYYNEAFGIVKGYMTKLMERKKGT